jgi:hypothetical protein
MTTASAPRRSSSGPPPELAVPARHAYKCKESRIAAGDVSPGAALR